MIPFFDYTLAYSDCVDIANSFYSELNNIFAPLRCMSRSSIHGNLQISQALSKVLLHRYGQSRTQTQRGCIVTFCQAHPPHSIRKYYLAAAAKIVFLLKPRRPFFCVFYACLARRSHLAVTHLMLLLLHIVFETHVHVILTVLDCLEN